MYSQYEYMKRLCRLRQRYGNTLIRHNTVQNRRTTLWNNISLLLIFVF